MESAVALLIFNRQDTTERVFLEIAKAKPKKLFVIADGPRLNRPDDPAKCDAARRVVERVDWDCEVLKNYSDVNMGCGRRIATGITWVFEHVAEAIFLEDDCVPHLSFFRYCDELLNKYHCDERVMTICGTNSLSGLVKPSYSYSFRYIMSCSGWATWRRAWRHFDLDIKLWEELRETSWMLNILREQRFVNYWKDIFDKYYCYKGNDVWDYQWMFACWTQNAFAIVPEVNLIQNIGFDENSTHCKSANHPLAFLTMHEIAFPLRHPPYIARELDAEFVNMNSFIEEKKQIPLYKRGIRKLRKWVA
jgi:hypothetical protein